MRQLLLLQAPFQLPRLGSPPVQLRLEQLHLSSMSLRQLLQVLLQLGHTLAPAGASLL
jgi:hypothetical protein